MCRCCQVQTKAVCTHRNVHSHSCSDKQGVTEQEATMTSRAGNSNIYIKIYMNINRLQHRKLQYKFKFKYNSNINSSCIDSMHFAQCADPSCILLMNILEATFPILMDPKWISTPRRLPAISACRKGAVIPLPLVLEYLYLTQTLAAFPSRSSEGVALIFTNSFAYQA